MNNVVIMLLIKSNLKGLIRFIVSVSPLIDLVVGSVGSYGGTDIVVGVLLPYTGDWPIGSRIASAAAIAVDDVQADPTLLPNRSIGFLWNDTHCKAGDGLYEVVDLWAHSSVLHLHGFIGGGCDGVCEPSGLLTAAWNLPMISWGCTSSSMSNKYDYPTFVRTVGPYYRSAPMLVEIFRHFDWSRAAIISSTEHSWQLTSSEVRTSLEDNGVYISHYATFEPGTKYLAYGEDDSHYISLTKTKDEARIILLFSYGGDVRDVMLYAHDLGMVSGDYVFFTVDLFDDAHIGNNTWMGDDGRDDDASAAFNSILNIHLLEPRTQEYENFTKEVRRRMANSPFYDPLDDHSVVDVHAALLYDALYLYAVALHEVLEAGENEYDGTQIVSKLLDRTFEGISGKVSIDENGDRIQDFALEHVVDGHYSYDIAEYYPETGIFIYKEDIVIVWPGGSNEAPRDHPDCGWDKEYCQQTFDVATVVGGSVGAVVAVVLMIVVVLNWRRMKYESALKDIKLWLVDFNEIDFTLHKSRALFKSYLTNNNSSRNTSYKSTCNNMNNLGSRPNTAQSVRGSLSLPEGECQRFCTVGNYKGNKVTIKKVRKSSIIINRDLQVEMKQMMDLQHSNINRFVGACTVAPNICYVMIYCNKGSLEDVLENSDISIDENFKISFASDIVQGLEFLSQSPMSQHGNLKSSNCVVDSHWVCKLTDFGLFEFRKHEDVESDVDENTDCRKLFWTAPEILRLKSLNESTTAFPGDVYAFGIILLEIVLRTGPYSSMLEVVEPKDIIESIKVGTVPKVRPAIPDDACKKQMAHLIKLCWDEDPLKRPTLLKIKSELRKISGGRTINIVDNMISMMEKYANNLEDLVHDRTLQLEEEKHKTDQLLYQMLPRTVADQLKKGLQVEAEYFDNVTIYFSDIVGFTKLASESTPLQVVAMLNDLYTTFDDVIDHYNVYKVETIGDAYMVVSGLPEKSENCHAGEIAVMSMELLTKVKHFSIRHRPGHRMQLRVGIHSGSVVAGVVGLKMPRYCLFGDTVNTASRMESSGLALRIHMSSATQQILSKSGGFNLEKRGEITVKGKIPIVTYWLKGKDGLEFDLPDASLAAPLEDHIFK